MRIRTGSFVEINAGRFVEWDEERQVGVPRDWKGNNSWLAWVSICVSPQVFKVVSVSRQEGCGRGMSGGWGMTGVGGGEKGAGRRSELTQMTRCSGVADDHFVCVLGKEQHVRGRGRHARLRPMVVSSRARPCASRGGRTVERRLTGHEDRLGERRVGVQCDFGGRRRGV